MNNEIGGEGPCLLGVIEDHRDAPSPTAVLPDLDSPSAVHDLVTRFYREIVFDELLEPIFGEVAEVDWAEHIPRLIDYWCWILFGTETERGFVMKVHRGLHEKRAIEPEHCDRWHALWITTIDAGWSGPYAEQAKGHAAALMAGMAKHVFGFTWTPPAMTRSLDIRTSVLYTCGHGNVRTQEPQRGQSAAVGDP